MKFVIIILYLMIQFTAYGYSSRTAHKMIRDKVSRNAFKWSLAGVITPLAIALMLTWFQSNGQLFVETIMVQFPLMFIALVIFPNEALSIVPKRK